MTADGTTDDDRLVRDIGIFNEQFYATAPTAYFHQRLLNLLVVAAGDATWGPRLRNGITIGDITLDVGQDECIVSDLTDEQRMQFVTAETEVLHHHLGEALLRFFLAHAEPTPCPWLEMSDIRIPEFDEKVRDVFVSPLTRDERLRPDIGWVFLGHREAPTRDGEVFAEWDEVTDNLMAFMRHFARHTDRHSGLYNAAKHGFAVKPGSAHLVIGSETGEGTPLVHAGPSLVFLERERVHKKLYNYTLTTQWLNLLRDWTLTHCGILMLDSLWHVGKQRYVGGVDGHPLYTPMGSENPEGIMLATVSEGGGAGVTKFGLTSVAIQRGK